MRLQLIAMHSSATWKTVRGRVLTSRFGSLLLLFQRSPLVQMLFPEARVLGGAGLAEFTKWTVTAVVGLGAYDTVAGATEVRQVVPDAGESIVPATKGQHLSFVFQVVNTPSVDNVSWSVEGLPNGLTHSDLSDRSTHLISGIPTEEGSTTVTVTAWEFQNQTGASFPAEFLIEVVPPIIGTHPASVAILNNTSTTLNVVANPNGGTLSFRWFRGTSPTGTQLSATSSSFTTPPLTATTSYWVRVTRDGVVSNSNTATVTIATPPAITTHPVSTAIASGTTTDLSVGVSGTSPAIQWFRGASGTTTDPVAGATSLSFTTPVLTTTTRYWARASNVAGTADSNAATVTVNADPYEDWRSGQFNASQLDNLQISGPAADPDGDGMTNQDEYVFGTLALFRESPALTIASSAGGVSLDFTAKLASGTGYTGKTRHYSLEWRSELGTGSWAAVTGFENITGSNQPVICTVSAIPPHAFYRLRVWLVP